MGEIAARIGINRSCEGAQKRAAQDVGLGGGGGDGIAEVATGSYLFRMRSVGLKILKNKLSEYVRLAAGGETVLVTDRDRVVAELGPPRPGRSEVLADAMLAEAVREGWLTPPAVVVREPPGRAPVMRLEELLSELDRDRSEG